MDVQPEPAEPDHPSPCASGTARDLGEDRALLMALARELDHPVLSMRGEIGLIVADGAEGTAERRDAARSLLELCDDLLGMTREWSAAPRGGAEAGRASRSQSEH